jgi:hypothetical protein
LNNNPAKSVTDKLGIKENMIITAINPPDDYAGILGRLPDNALVTKELKEGAGFIHFFAKNGSILAAEFPALKKALRKDGVLWVSWPKASSKAPAGINERAVRETGLLSGLVDVKVCSVSEVWSGLKFVYRQKDRK